MKVGLIRHFKVTRGYPNTMVTTDELLKWIEEYDASDVEEKEIDLKEIEWKKCFASDLPRAKVTAEKAFLGEIVYLKELREIQLSPFFRKNIRLPLFIHLLFIRIAWLLKHQSQKDQKADVIKRLQEVLDEALASGEDVLIVSHGGIMMFLRKELIRRGFQGEKFKRADHAKLYLFEKRY